MAEARRSWSACRLSAPRRHASRWPHCRQAAVLGHRPGPGAPPWLGLAGRDRLEAERAAAEKLALAGLAEELTVLDDDAAAREDMRRRADHLAALERRVVDAHVEGLLREDVALLRIPDDDIGIGADGERALARIEAEDLGRRRRRDLDEAIERDLPGAHAFPEEIEAGLDSRHAIRDLREIVAAELLLLLHAERAMVGRDHLQIVVSEAAPQVILVMLGAERRRAHELGALEAGPRQVILRREQVL